MPVQESKGSLSIFPLNASEYWYFQKFVDGKTNSDLVREGFPLTALRRNSTAIKRKLVARTLAQGVWKASEAGVEMPEHNHKSSHPFMKSLERTQQDVLRMLAGGYYALEIDSALGISRYERERTIKGFYTRLPASSHPQLIACAIESKFFNKHSPIVFSESKQHVPRPDDKLSTDQDKLLYLYAQGKTYARIATELTDLRDEPISVRGVISGLQGLAAKVAKLSGSPVLPPYQTVIRATDLGLFPLEEYFQTNGLDPSLILALPDKNRDELKKAYARVLDSGEWIGRTGKENNAEAKRSRKVYKSIGAKNSMQAVLMLHSLEPAPVLESRKEEAPIETRIARRRGRKEKPSNSMHLPMPNGSTVLLTAREINDVEEVDRSDILKRIADLPENGYVSAAIEDSGGRVVTILTALLRDDKTYDPGSPDLTYPRLIEAYNTIATILERNPHMENVGMILRFVDQRLKKLNSGTKTS